jgi:glycosyltransferase involved in cell wall biosynthesis
MRATISCGGTFHATLMANDFAARNVQTLILSSAPRHLFGALDPNVQIKFVPLPVQIFSRLSGLSVRKNLIYMDFFAYDQFASMRLKPCDLFVGWADLSLCSAKRAKRFGAKYVLERACPHVDFQQKLLHEEASKVGHCFMGEPQWSVERQYEEYQLADCILVPSYYSANTFSEELRKKIIIAPLYARMRIPPPNTRPGGRKMFTVGVVGGEPLRKGYLYLLQAWQKLNLPNAVLRIRTGRGFDEFPALRELARLCPNVEFVEYVKNMNDFYQTCDLFILPSVDDGFGMALLEAMSNGVPSIATTRCGAVELLTDREEVYVIKPFDVDGIASAIDQLYCDSEYRLRLGSAGQQAVVGMLSGNYPTHYHKALDALFN